MSGHLRGVARSLGPGILFAGAAIGVSHLVQATRTGALFGLWPIVVILFAHIAKYPAMVFGPRYAAATGVSLIEAYREQGRLPLASFAVIAVGTSFTILAAVTLVCASVLRTALGLQSIDLVWISAACLLVSAIVFALFMAAIANAIHLEAILGAFAAGVILNGMPHRHHLLERFEPIAGLLAPIFFIVVGAKTDLSVLNPANPDSAEGLWIASFLIIIAVVGKVAAGYFIPAAELNRLAIGLGMIPRGEVGLVFVGIGASVDILSSTLTAAVILTVVVTTLIAPVLLPWALPNNIASEQQA